MTDLLMVLTVSLLVTLIRFGGPGELHAPLGRLRALEHFGLLCVFALLLIVCCESQKLYAIRTRRLSEEAWVVLRAVSSATLFLVCVIYLSGAHSVSRLVVGAAAVASAGALIGYRILRRWRLLAGDIVACHNVLIVGTGKVACALQEYLARNPQFGFVVKGLIEELPVALTGTSGSRRGDLDRAVLGTVDEMLRIARQNFIDEVFITVPTERELVKRVALEARSAGFGVRVVPDLFDGLGWGAPIEFLGRFPTMSLHERPIPLPALWAKRIIDILAASVGLVLLSPLLLVIAAAVRLTSSGPIFYRSTRIGKKGNTFQCYKFRSMVANAEDMKKSLLHLNERDGILFKISKDPRITPLGAFLRKYSLDELPHLWNVEKGDMSLVGPRPPVPGEYNRYELEHLRRLDVVPGITGLWQVKARQSPSFEDYINLDLEYVENWSVWLDIKLLYETVRVVCAGTGK
jgi:exopolysaccharide biosynthesis polyprenyl glycosylphosphotransferase